MGAIPEVILHVHPDDGQEWECQCARCGSSLVWERCDDCGGDGISGHDCGEDSCCCLHPEENVMCGTCEGRGGWNYCLSDGKDEWCRDNPLPGREDIRSGTPEWFVVSRSPSGETGEGRGG